MNGHIVIRTFPRMVELDLLAEQRGMDRAKLMRYCQQKRVQGSKKVQGKWFVPEAFNVQPVRKLK